MNHQEIIELLPWYVNATLDAAERQVVAEHLEGCKECASEVRALTNLRKVVVAVGDQAPEPSPFMLNRALAEIENYERDRAKAQSTETQKSNSFRSRVGNFAAGWWPSTPLFARAAMAAQLALLIVAATFAVYQYNHPNIVYRSLSGNSSQENGAVKAKAMISVGFNDKASAREIKQALNEVSGTIVDGPSSLGLYTVQLPFASDQTADLDKAVQTLLKNRHVVSFAASKP